MGPPPGVPAGPPAGIPAGPPAAATSHIPQGAALGKPDGLPGSAKSIGPEVSASASANAQNDPSLADAASLLKQLNAAHASDTGLVHASSKSIVGALGIYKTSTLSAQTDVNTYTQAVANDQQAVTDAQQALTDAQNAMPFDQAAVDTAQANLTAAQNQLAADQSSLTAAQQAVTDAQTQLASSTKTTLTPEVIGDVNSLLGI